MTVRVKLALVLTAVATIALRLAPNVPWLPESTALVLSAITLVAMVMAFGSAKESLWVTTTNIFCSFVVFAVCLLAPLLIVTIFGVVTVFAVGGVWCRDLAREADRINALLGTDKDGSEVREIR